uniref:transcriptional adapter 1 isoform X2 n=1 Tax=Myxine glutinosa TaxID=7769 RepID=UPI0035900E00
MEPVALAVGELEQAKRCLGEALGENSKAYWANMKLWFRQKISKEEFDIEARRLLTHDNVHLHNDFLLSILTKCQIMVTVPGMKDGGPGRSSKSSRKKKLPSLRGKFEHRFQPQDPLLGAPQFCARETHRSEEPSLCSRPLLVPGVPQLTARALVTAWECGLDNMTDEAATYLMSALEYHIKDVIMAVVMRRKAYCLRYGLFRHAFGTTSIPQPYLRNSIAVHAAMSQRYPSTRFVPWQMSSIQCGCGYTGTEHDGGRDGGTGGHDLCMLRSRSSTRTSSCWSLRLARSSTGAP